MTEKYTGVIILDKVKDPFNRIGLKRVVNAATSLTTLGGSMPKKMVFDSMYEASRGFIRIPDLQKRVGDLLAEKFGAEAGLPVAGAVNGLMLAVAACMFKGTQLEDYDPLGGVSWIEIIQRLPLRTEGLRNEFVILGNSRSTYDHSIECAGGLRVEAGSKEGVSEEDLRKSFNPEKTAALYYTKTPSADYPIDEFCALAQELDVPAIVDAAPYLTHGSIPGELLKAGADLLILSGGKQLGALNNTGILLGGRHLIKLAHLNAYPFDGIGRGAKMSRETIMGLLAAVEDFVSSDRDEYYRRMRLESEVLADRINSIPEVKAGVLDEPSVIDGIVLPTYVWVESESPRVSTKGLFDALMSHDPVIRSLYQPYFISTEVDDRITVKVEYLLPGDDNIVVNAIESIIS